jgi:hypothetical protein
MPKPRKRAGAGLHATGSAPCRVESGGELAGRHGGCRWKPTSLVLSRDGDAVDVAPEPAAARLAASGQRSSSGRRRNFSTAAGGEASCGWC